MKQNEEPNTTLRRTQNMTLMPFPLRLYAILVSLFVGLSVYAMADTKGAEAQRQEEIRSQKTQAKKSREVHVTQENQKPSKDILKKKLTDMQYQVTQEEGTEAPYMNAYWNETRHGIYVDIVSGEPLFSSLDKYDAGCGWPSFTRPIRGTTLTERSDHKLQYERTEVRSKGADSHLGHVFPDGPKTGDNATGLRYCINSAAMRFIPIAELEQEGYSDYVHLFKDVMDESTQQSLEQFETAYLAGGCFWGMEEIIRGIPGVVSTDVGYTGGHVPNANYQDVKTGTTGHAEAVRVIFKPAELSFRTLLKDWFFKMHDPTTLNRQGNDIGDSYRSAIFYLSEEQKKVAEAVIKEINAAQKWDKPIVTEVTHASPFYKAENYHQDYLQKNPDGYTCHFMRD